MRLSLKQDASFIVRVWWDYDSADSPVWRGWIQHVQDKEGIFFHQNAALLAFIAHHTGIEESATDAQDNGTAS